MTRLNTTWCSPGIPESAVKDRLTNCHLSLRHGTHTVSLGTVFRGLLLYIRCVHHNRVTTIGCGSSTHTDGLESIEDKTRNNRLWRKARGPVGAPVSPLGKLVLPVRPCGHQLISTDGRLSGLLAIRYVCGMGQCGLVGNPDSKGKYS